MPPAPPAPRSRRATDESLLLLVSSTSFVGTALALNALSYLPRFDASGSLFGRWDAVHFFSVAGAGYQWEQQAAFQPGWHALLHYASPLIASLRSLAGFPPVSGRDLWVEGAAQAPSDTELAALLLNLVFRGVATVALYRLATRLAGRRAGLAAGLLYCYPPSPASLLTYTEPGFAAAYFGGLLLLSSRRWPPAALLFAAATSFRGTGVFAAAVLGWSVLFAPAREGARKERNGRIVPAPARRGPAAAYVADALAHPARSLSRAVYAVLLALLVAAPFLAFNTYLWSISCPGRDWCAKSLPLAYTAIQKRYWNIGLLHYWTLEQLPNLVIALPVLLPTGAGIWSYFAGRPLHLHSTKAHDHPHPHPSTHTPSPTAEKTAEEPAVVERTALADALHAHSAFLLLTLVFGSHTQIALRLAITDPVPWLTLATNPGLRKWWVRWCFLWAAAGLALWAGHYPPA